VCVRHVPEGMTDEADLRAHNLALMGSVNKSGKYYLTPSVLKGRQIIRVSIGSSATELADVEGLWEALIEASMRAAG